MLLFPDISGAAHPYNAEHFIAFNTVTLLDIANKVIGKDEIGSMPVHGVDAQWFVDQFQELVAIKPQAAQWDEHKIYCAMCHLYVLDPCDLAE